MARYLRRMYPDVRRLLSYQDSEAHTGTIYKAAGWVVGAISDNSEWGSHPKNSGYDMRPIQSDARKLRWQRDFSEIPQADDAVARSAEVSTD